MRIKVYEEQLEDGEKKEVQIYEGVYLEKVDADKRTFLDALPFIPKKRRYNAYGNSASTSSPYITTSRRTRIGESTWESAGDTVLSISTVTMPC